MNRALYQTLTGSLAALSMASAGIACDFGHSLFRRADGATIAVKDDPRGETRWFQAAGIEDVAGFQMGALNCTKVEAACVQVWPVNSAGSVIEGHADGDVSLTSDGRDAWPGAYEDEAPLFVWINGFGTFFRECVNTR